MPRYRSVITKTHYKWSGGAALLAVLGFAIAAEALHAEERRVVPPPAMDEPATVTSTERAVFAGGCFWGVQGVFQHVAGVTSAVSGYAGGDKETADYRTVSRGTTAHAESVEITFDPRKISYGRLLQIYFSVAHDPTQLNRQGPDVGRQYRSAIFATTADQAAIATAYIAQLDEAHVFKAAIVTKVEPGASFFRAETYHQDYATRHPTDPYIRNQRFAENCGTRAPLPAGLSR